MTDNASRQPKGIPVGGQFAATAHTEPDVALTHQVTPFHDADGTPWEFDGDEHTDIYTSMHKGVEARITVDIRESGARVTVYDHRGTRRMTVADQAQFESLDEAKDHAKSVRTRTSAYEHNYLSVGDHTPWGQIEETKCLAPGIDAVYTDSHGGLKLSPERAKAVDAKWREPLRGFYEEDCAWSKAVITHHQDLSEEHVKAAHETARRWYPVEYEKVVGKDPAKYGVTDYQPITAAESHVVAENELKASA